MIKTLITSSWLLFSVVVCKSQIFYNNGATVQVTSGTYLILNTDFTNVSGSSFNNNGTVILTGNLLNNQTMPLPYNGLLRFNGTAAQTVSGSAAYLAQNAEVNNSAGITLSNTLAVNATFTFTNGMVTAPNTSAPLRFTSTGTYTGVSDARHVDGYVVKEGTGAFSYPVGDNVRHQPVDVNLTANNTGLQVKYFAADAGSGTFSTAGTEATPLVSYNTREYWDITPLSGPTGAAGTVTVYWDGYNDAYSNPITQRKVAHKSGTNWLNEGTTAVGSEAAGSVTSNGLSSWSPFALGSITAVLPVRWLTVNGSMNSFNNAVVSWSVDETNVSVYNVEKSIDAITFQSIGTVESIGNGNHTYSFTDQGRLTQPAYYRIKQIDIDGKYTYSAAVRIAPDQQLIKAYPLPFKNEFTVTSSKMQKAILYDALGKPLQLIQLQRGSNLVYTAGLVKGTYYLRVVNGETIKLVKH